LEHPRFRAAFDFFVLRAASGEVDQDIARWWEDFQHAGDTEKEAMLVVEDNPKRRRKRGPRRKKPAGENSSTALDTNSKPTQPDEDDLDD
jgi:poly(A) polymerase